MQVMNNNLLQNLLDTLEDPLFALDGSYRYIGFNYAHAVAMRELYGVEIVLGGCLRELQPVAEDWERAKSNIDRALAGERVTERALSGEEGRGRKCFEVIHSPLRDGTAITGVIILARDITDQQHTENSLLQSEQKYRTLFEMDSDALFLVDRETGCIMETNKVAESMYGYTREEMLRMRNVDLSAEPDETHRVTHSGQTWIPTRYHRRRDGTVIPVEITARHFTWQNREVHLAAIRDIAPRLRVEEALRKSEAALREAQAVARLGSWELGISDAVPTWSAEMFRIFERDPRDGVPSWEEYRRYIHPEDHPGIKQALDRARTHGTSYSREIRIILPSGKTAWIWTVGNAITDSTGAVARLFGTVQDVTERKLAEMALSQANQQLQQAHDRTQRYLDVAGMMLLALDRKGTVEMINRRGAELLGVSAARIIGLNWFDEFIPPTHREALRAHYQDCVAGLQVPTPYHESPVQTSSGAVRWMAWHNTMLLTEGDLINGTLSSGEDITEKRETEAALRLDEERLEALWRLSTKHDLSTEQLVEHALDDAVRLTESAGGFFHFVEQESSVRLFKCSRQLLTRYAPSQSHPLALVGPWADCVKTKRPMVINHHVEGSSTPETPGGCVPLHRFISAPVFDGNQVVAILGVINKPTLYDDSDVRQLDIFAASLWSLIKHKQAQEDLSDSEHRFRLLYQHSPLAFQALDQEGLLVDVNQQWMELLGWEKTRVLGRPFTELLAPGQDAAWNRLRRLLKTEGGCNGEEIILLHRSGKHIPVAIDARAANTPNICLPFHHCIVRDLRPQRSAEAERLRLEAALRQQQKLEAIGSLASGVAHEINNPINIILNHAYLIKQDESASPQVLEGAAAIMAESARVGGIVRDLLRFSRHENDAFTASSICHIVEGTLNLIRNILRKESIVLEVDMAPDLPMVVCRPQQIQQVLMNLVANARDALNMRYPQEHPNKQLQVAARHLVIQGQPWVRLAVADKGSGISEEIRARVFDPFFTTKPRDQGTGLGLSISYRIIREHGGELTFDTEQGNGTRFNILLPCTPVNSSHGTHAQEPEQTP